MASTPTSVVMVPGQVYRTLFSLNGNLASQQDKESDPSFTVTGAGDVNFYFSNDKIEPANTAAMLIDQNGPYVENGYGVENAYVWVAYEDNSGTNVVTAFNVVVG